MTDARPRTGAQGKRIGIVWREPPIAFCRVHGGNIAKIGGVSVRLCKRHLSSNAMLLIYEGILTPTHKRQKVALRAVFWQKAKENARRLPAGPGGKEKARPDPAGDSLLAVPVCQ